jgi:hypothetical protein
MGKLIFHYLPNLYVDESEAGSASHIVLIMISGQKLLRNFPRLEQVEGGTEIVLRGGTNAPNKTTCLINDSSRCETRIVPSSLSQGVCFQLKFIIPMDRISAQHCTEGECDLPHAGKKNTSHS